MTSLTLNVNGKDHTVNVNNPDMPLLWCDAMLVSQLLENLLDNALKYSPVEASVELQVRQQLALAFRQQRPRWSSWLGKS